MKRQVFSAPDNRPFTPEEEKMAETYNPLEEEESYDNEEDEDSEEEEIKEKKPKTAATKAPQKKPAKFGGLKMSNN